MHRTKTHITDQKWGVVVIGGGPAGMMAAARAASLGAKVLLIEKNDGLGKKLLITGGGRCNVTNAELDNKKLLAKFGDSGKFLFSPFSQWSVADTLEFFHARNMPTKEEAEQRVFPLSNSAQSVWDVLVASLQENNVSVHSHAPVSSLRHEDGRVVAAVLRDGTEIHATSFILATGGVSHPETGSTGDGYRWLRSIGHTVVDATAALVPIALKNPAVRAAGTSLTNAKVTLFQNDVRQAQTNGKILFTHIGLSGPAILNMSRDIGELLKYGEVMIEIDLWSDKDYDKAGTLLQETLTKSQNKKLKNSLTGLVAPGLVEHILAQADIDPEIQCNSISREARVRLMKALKHTRWEVAHLLGLHKAVITAGGVVLTEIDFKSMRSLKADNLYIVGDLLNINRPSGGYSLQLCWTTGFVAGSAAAEVAQNYLK